MDRDSVRLTAHPSLVCEAHDGARRPCGEETKVLDYILFEETRDGLFLS